MQKARSGTPQRSWGGGGACRFQPVEAKEEHHAAGEPSIHRTSGKTKRKWSVKDDKASCSQKMVQDSKRVSLQKKRLIPPLPIKLPLLNLLHWDTVRAWRQQLKLSTKGLKLEAYKRLCEYAYPNQKDIPITAKEAKILTKSQRKLKMKRGKWLWKDLIFLKWLLPLRRRCLLLKGYCSPWGYGQYFRNFHPRCCLPSAAVLQPGLGRWKQWHHYRRPLVSGGVWSMGEVSLQTQGWVQLQFYVGQAWVPEKQRKVSALFLLPACNFLPPHLEDNMLCPKGIYRYKGFNEKPPVRL